MMAKKILKKPELHSIQGADMAIAKKLLFRKWLIANKCLITKDGVHCYTDDQLKAFDQLNAEC